jgi:hypothetical protein
MDNIRFDSVIHAFDEYSANLAPPPDYIRDLAAEARKRMLQLDWILVSIAQLEQEWEPLHQSLSSAPNPPDQATIDRASRIVAFMDQIELLAEVFYFFA